MPDTQDRRRRRRIKPERLPLGEAARIIDLIVSFYVAWPKLGVQFSGESPATQAQGERVALALGEAFDQLNPAADSPWKQGVWQQALFGRRADFIPPGHEYYWDFPYKEDGESEQAAAERRREWRMGAPLPLLWQNLPVENTFPASLSSLDQEVISWRSVTWSDLLRMFSREELRNVPAPDQPHQLMTLGIYADRQWIAYSVLADRKGGGVFGVGGAYPDRIIRSIPHDMGRCPIRILPGITTARKEPPYFWRSVLYPVLGSLEALERLAARAMTSAKFDVLPLLQEHLNLTSQEEGEGAEAEMKRFLEGDVITYDAGDAAVGRGREGLSPVFQPQHGDQTRELLVYLKGDIARRTGAVDVLEGVFQPGTPAWSSHASAEFAKNKNSPLTQSVVAAAIDIAETISAAVQSFGEPVVLTKLDEEGGAKGRMLLEPDKLRRYRAVLSGTYEAKVPSSELASADAMMRMLAQQKELGAPSPIWIMERFGSIDDPWRHYREALEWSFMMSEEVRAMQLRDIAEQFEAHVADQEGMAPDEFMGVAPRLPPQVAELIMQRARGQRPSASRAVSGATGGALRAATPFSVAPGGPQPETTIIPGQQPQVVQ